MITSVVIVTDSYVCCVGWPSTGQCVTDSAQPKWLFQGVPATTAEAGLSECPPSFPMALVRMTDPSFPMALVRMTDY